MKTWNIKRTTFSVADFRGWAKDKSLVLSPSFQRRPVWKKAAKSYFVDTIMRDLPVPIIFLREKTEISTMKTIREVVDGQQRLRSILAFIDPDSKFKSHSDQDNFSILKIHNPKFGDMVFADLPNAEKHRILAYQFSVHVLPSDTSDKDVLEIFARMNSTGTTLNDQELRNAKYFGKFKTSAFEESLDQLENWRRWKLFSEQDIARMQEAELTSELFILIIEEIKSRTKKAIDDFYEKYDVDFSKQNVVAKRFRATMESIDNLIGEQIAQTSFAKRTLFYPLFALFYDRLYGLGSALNNLKVKSIPSNFKTRLLKANELLVKERAGSRVLEAAARRTTHAGNRKILFEFLDKITSGK